MEINSSGDMLKAIDLLIIQMDRPQRKKFQNWIKDRRHQYDLLYPQGWKPPVEEAPKPSILVPENSKTSIIIPQGVTNEASQKESSAANRYVVDVVGADGVSLTPPITPA
jgi:hypothetical protein